MRAPNEQVTSDVKALKAKVEARREAAKTKETVAVDVNQDLTVGESGGVAKGVTPADAAVYEPAPATYGEANETDAAPAKPKPKVPPASTGGPTVKVAPLPGFESIGDKRKRDSTGVAEKPFVALNTGKKKAKTFPDEADSREKTGGRRPGDGAGDTRRSGRS